MLKKEGNMCKVSFAAFPGEDTNYFLINHIKNYLRKI